MSELINLEFEGLPPTANLMYRGLKGHRYKPKSVLEYQKYTTALIREQWQGRETFTGLAALYVRFETDNRRRWDIDNRVKALQDCITLAGVLKDDTQIYFLQVKREYGSKTATAIKLLSMEAE
ncbi:MAG: RusA family crossover junction endodeoxyribonuclease [Synergistaceae bacterium]|nr:RusA family crossover junction endodeoxyribonuclease [Synergistaceae bacterium]